MRLPPGSLVGLRGGAVLWEWRELCGPGQGWGRCARLVRGTLWHSPLTACWAGVCQPSWLPPPCSLHPLEYLPKSILRELWGKRRAGGRQPQLPRAGACRSTSRNGATGTACRGKWALPLPFVEELGAVSRLTPPHWHCRLFRQWLYPCWWWVWNHGIWAHGGHGTAGPGLAVGSGLPGQSLLCV